MVVQWMQILIAKILHITSNRVFKNIRRVMTYNTMKKFLQQLEWRKTQRQSINLLALGYGLRKKEKTKEEEI
jgi:hypothetical protein